MKYVGISQIVLIGLIMFLLGRIDGANEAHCNEECRQRIIEEELVLTIGQLEQPWTPRPERKPVD